MFEAAELGRKIGKKEFKEQTAALRTGLLTVQYELRDADFPVVLVLAGSDRLGCAEVMNLLHEWMDARYLEANVFASPTEEERERPRFWRYWRSLPAKGRIGIYYREWTFGAILDRLTGTIDEAELDRRLRHIEGFERALIDDGAVVLKFWFHLSRDALAKRLRKSKKKAERSWEVTKQDRLVLRHYPSVRETSEEVLRRTSVGEALWNVIESADFRYRDVTVSQLLIQTLTKRLARPLRPKPSRPRPPDPDEANPLTVLNQVDLTRSLGKELYERELNRSWAKLANLAQKTRRRGVSVVLVFEGWDAAGKGGVIRRLTKPLSAAHYRVVPIAAPTEDERNHHYLWRFWKRLPRAGHWTFFDRSWYGRVLVERLEGLATEDEWRRAYSEINDFEEQIVDGDVVLLKFWMQVSAEEQLRRFKEREKVPFKKYKITPEDYRNRERWNAYELAADEMILRTSTNHARWHLIAGDDKHWARIQVLKTVCRELEGRLKGGS